MFAFDPGRYAAEYAERGYVHIRKGLRGEFLETLTRQIDDHLEATRLKEWAINDKQQSLYAFPEDGDYLSELKDVVGRVSGLEPERLVLSERHIKAYEVDADPHPLAHKDRLASQVSVGLSIRVPEGSRLLLYPEDDPGVNPFNTAQHLRDGLAERAPEPMLSASTRRVVIEDAPGDVIMFRGNAFWHLREKPAGTRNLYLKLNAFNCDPLGEDPQTPERTGRSRRLLELPDEALSRMVPLVARRVDYVHRQYTREWQEVVEAVFWGKGHVILSEEEFRLLRSLDWQRDVAGLSRLLGSDVAPMVRRLAASGVIELVEPARSIS
jgi:hypothetical protein